jgi:hypothetical protein
MGPVTRSTYSRRPLGRLFGRQAQRALLVGDGEPVPALDLDGGRALRAHLGDPRGQQRAQVVVGRGARGGHGGRDPAAVVALARHPRGELGRAVAREHQVGVGVDEAGDHRAALDVDAAVDRRRDPVVPHPHDLRVGDDHGGPPERPELGVVGGELPDACDDRGGHTHRRRLTHAFRHVRRPRRVCVTEGLRSLR